MWFTFILYMQTMPFFLVIMHRRGSVEKSTKIDCWFSESLCHWDYIFYHSYIDVLQYFCSRFTLSEAITLEYCLLPLQYVSSFSQQELPWRRRRHCRLFPRPVRSPKYVGEATRYARCQEHRHLPTKQESKVWNCIVRSRNRKTCWITFVIQDSYCHLWTTYH